MRVACEYDFFGLEPETGQWQMHNIIVWYSFAVMINLSCYTELIYMFLRSVLEVI